MWWSKSVINGSGCVAQFWKSASLKDRIPISERHILNLLGNFLALLRAAQPAKVASLLPQWEELGGLILYIDGMQPEKGNPALYVVRETQLDVSLAAEILETGNHKTIKYRAWEHQLALTILAGLSPIPALTGWHAMSTTQCC